MGNFELESLEKKLNHKFKDKTLLRKALTHGSASEASNPLNSYQRLEFLGDRVLGLAMADILYQNFPNSKEGALSRHLTSLVRKESCTKIGQKLSLGQYIILGSGEARNGGREKPSILADVVEALLGALFIEIGFEAVKNTIEHLWQDQISKGNLGQRDHKTALQELSHKVGLGVPAYRLIDRIGPDHEPIFTIEVNIDKNHSAKGEGSSKREAQQEAARTLKAIISERENKGHYSE